MADGLHFEGAIMHLLELQKKGLDVRVVAPTADARIALRRASLTDVQSRGPANIQAHRIPMIRTLQAEMPRLGFVSVTPANSTAANVTFARKNVADSDVPKRLLAAKVNVRVAQHWLRVSPSVYNNMSDIDWLLNALS